MKLCKDCKTERELLDLEELDDLMTTCEVIAEKGRFFSDKTNGHYNKLNNDRIKQSSKNKSRIKTITKYSIVSVISFLIGVAVVYGFEEAMKYVR